MSLESAPLRLVGRRTPRGQWPQPFKASAVVLAAAVAAAVVSSPVTAQTAGKGFLFKKPAGSFTLRGGYAVANAGSDVFSEAARLLTLDKRDFSGFAVGGDIAVAASPRVDVVIDGEYSSAGKNSEYRDFIDNKDQPIQQATHFKRVPLSVGLRYYLTDRGRSVSQFAWIPSRYVPYVGVGAGAMYYRFRQNGDFIDFNSENSDIIPLELSSSGWSPMGQGIAGVDYTIGPWFAITGEGRYVWAKANLDPTVYEGFEKIDLSGFAGSVGLKIRF